MDKEKVNEIMALYFGFKKSEGKEYLVNGLPQWTFPRNFPLRQCVNPNTSIPDFVGILEDYIRLMEKHGATSGYPREYFFKTRHKY